MYIRIFMEPQKQDTCNVKYHTRENFGGVNFWQMGYPEIVGR